MGKSRKQPPVLLLHGFMQTGLTWTEVARELAREWFVVAPDFIGHGQTEIENPDAKGAVSFEGAIQQIEAVAKELFDTQAIYPWRIFVRRARC